VRSWTHRCRLALALTTGLVGCGRPEGPPARHLILVVFDTLRADRMSIYGHDAPTTPFLDGLAPELVRFVGVRAPAPWTLPSHASLFTGLWPVEHGVHWAHKRLDPSFTTLAEVLREHGFCAYGLSANPVVSELFGLDQGFEQFQRIPQPRSTQAARLLQHVPAILETADTRDCRLFLFVNLMETHTPTHSAPHGPAFGLPGPPPVDDTRAKWEITAGERPFPDEERQRHLAAYDAAVRAVDDAARGIYEALAARGLLADTLLVFTSDHGEGLGQHAELGHVLSVWEEQLAIPLLVRFPGAHRGGEVVERAASLVALTPTLFDWLAVERPAVLSRAPGLDTAAATADYRSYFDPAFAANQRMKQLYPGLAEHVRHAHVVYCPPYKLIVHPSREVELFDLGADPGERRDLAPSPPRAYRDCLAVYHEQQRAGRFTPFDAELAAEPTTDEDLEALRSLGYVQ
jgi:arylsulfatase A-like enzyme